MLFEELVEQHRVDLLVADASGFSFFVQYYQVRIHLCYFFSNQTPFGRVGHVALVMECHWSKRKDHFTGLVHGLNVLLSSSFLFPAELPLWLRVRKRRRTSGEIVLRLIQIRLATPSLVKTSPAGL